MFQGITGRDTIVIPSIISICNACQQQSEFQEEQSKRTQCLRRARGYSGFTSRPTASIDRISELQQRYTRGTRAETRREGGKFRGEFSTFVTKNRRGTRHVPGRRYKRGLMQLFLRERPGVCTRYIGGIKAPPKQTHARALVILRANGSERDRTRPRADLAQG